MHLHYYGIYVFHERSSNRGECVEIQAVQGGMVKQTYSIGTKQLLKEEFPMVVWIRYFCPNMPRSVNAFVAVTDEQAREYGTCVEAAATMLADYYHCEREDITVCSYFVTHTMSQEQRVTMAPNDDTLQIRR